MDAPRLPRAGRRPVSIVIATLNEERYLPRLLLSLAFGGSRTLEIIVVDGGSEDSTPDVVERFRRVAPLHVTIRLLRSPIRNVWAQRNQGAAAARHDMILFLDADVVIDGRRELNALVHHFRSGHVAAASCRFRPLERDPRAGACYALLYWLQKTVEPWRPHAIGACIVTTRRLFERCGGFDPRRSPQAGADYCRRAARLGTFRIVPVSVRLSSRRFARKGYWRTGLAFLRTCFDRGGVRLPGKP